jgi:protein ImuA
MNALLQQLQNRQLIWQASQTEAPYEHCQSTGFAALDKLLGGGWPQHTVIELQSHGACAEVQLIDKALDGSGSELLQIWINPPAQLCAEYLLQQQRPLHQVLQLQAPRSADALWAAELCLKSGSCADVLLWQHQLNLTQLKRLQLAAAQGQSQLYLFRPALAEQQLLPWALSLQLLPVSAGLQIRILKRKGGWQQQELLLPWAELYPHFIKPQLQQMQYSNPPLSRVS